MALEIKIRNTNNVTPDGNTITIEDYTGTYNSTTNPTGYGTPNDPRYAQALFMLGQNKTTKGDVNVTINTYNPISTYSYTANVTKDGWYKFSLYSVPMLVLGDLSTYADGTVLYNTSLNSLVKVLDEIVGSGNQATIIRSLVLATVADIPDLYIVASVESFFIANNSKTKLKLNTTITELIFKQVTFTDKQLVRAKDNYNMLRAVLQGAIYEYARGNKFVAQKNIEFLNSNNYEQC